MTKTPDRCKPDEPLDDAGPVADKAKRISVILMSFVGFTQGFLGPLVKLLHFAPLPLVAGRCAVAAATLHAICALTGRRIVKQDRLAAFVCGLLLAGHFGTLFVAYSMTDVNVVLIALFTYPMMTTLLEPLFFGGRPQARQLLSACLVVMGVGCLRSSPGHGTQMYAGVGLALLSALLFSVRNILSRKLVMKSDGLAIMAWQTSVATLVFAPTCVGLHASAVPANVWLGVLALGIVFTALPHTVRVLVKQHLTTTTVDILAALQVVGGLALASLLLHEPLTLGVSLGAGLVLFAVLREGTSVWRGGAKRWRVAPDRAADRT